MAKFVKPLIGARQALDRVEQATSAVFDSGINHRYGYGFSDRSSLPPPLPSRLLTEYQQQYNKAMQADLAIRAARETELAKVEQSIAQIVDAIADGMYHPSMKEKMTALEARNEAVEVLRGLVSSIRLTPDSEGDLHIELVGELGAVMLLGEADDKKPRRGSARGFCIRLRGPDHTGTCKTLRLIWTDNPENLRFRYRSEAVVEVPCPRQPRRNIPRADR